jgi:alpha/beta superfamily hydrolase
LDGDHPRTEQDPLGGVSETGKLAEGLSPRDLGDEHGIVPGVLSGLDELDTVVPGERIAQHESRASNPVGTRPEVARFGHLRHGPTSRSSAHLKDEPMEGITFDTEDGIRLEAELRFPDAGPKGSAVICHPHPRQGGSKDHPLLWAIRNELAARELVVLSFNFRGVMGSEGSYGGGVDELMYVRAAIGRVGSEAGGRTLACGWSFGAHVALREAVQDDRVDALALIGLPLSESSLSLPDLSPLPELPSRQELKVFERPVLLLAGQADPFCPLPELAALARRIPGAEVEIVEGTDHFFWKRERETARIVGAFASRALLKAGQDG